MAATLSISSLAAARDFATLLSLQCFPLQCSIIVGKKSYLRNITHSLYRKQGTICIDYGILVRTCQMRGLTTKINWAYLFYIIPVAHLRLCDIRKTKFKLWRSWIKISPLVRFKRSEELPEALLMSDLFEIKTRIPKNIIQLLKLSSTRPIINTTMYPSEIQWDSLLLHC